MKKLLAVLFLLFFVSSFVSAQSKMALSGNVGAALPMGDFGDAFKTGLGAHATFFYNLNQNIDLTGSLGYYSWTSKESSDVTFSSVPVLVGARYNLGKMSSLQPYGVAELGLHFATAEAKIFGATYSASETDFGFGLGAGAYYPLDETTKIDVNLKYNVISSDGSNAYISIAAGVVFGL